jgi:hypothetical protein
MMNDREGLDPATERKLEKVIPMPGTAKEVSMKILWL